VLISCPDPATPTMTDTPQPLMAAFQRLTHQLHVADTLETIIRRRR